MEALVLTPLLKHSLTRYAKIILPCKKRRYCAVQAADRLYGQNYSVHGSDNGCCRDHLSGLWEFFGSNFFQVHWVRARVYRSRMAASDREAFAVV